MHNIVHYQGPIVYRPLTLHMYYGLHVTYGGSRYRKNIVGVNLKAVDSTPLPASKLNTPLKDIEHVHANHSVFFRIISTYLMMPPT